MLAQFSEGHARSVHLDKEAQVREAYIGKGPGSKASECSSCASSLCLHCANYELTAALRLQFHGCLCVARLAELQSRRDAV